MNVNRLLDSRLTASLLGVFLLGSLIGCGTPRNPEWANTVPVSGNVTYNGSPVEGATVTFRPASSQERGATGVTDASGQFRLMTYEANDGAIPGSFRVTIQKTVVEGGGETDDSLAPPPKTVEHLPVRYRDPDTSGLVAEVKEGEENEFPFALSD
jgi:hypothetical protein